MNKNVMIAIIVVILILAGLGWWYFSMQPTASVDSNSDDVVADDESNQMMRGSMMSLLAAGKSVSCTFDRDDATGSQQGTVYVSGGKMRGDFIINQAGGNSTTMHMISDSEWAYTWGDELGVAQGIKMKVAAVQAGSDTNTNANRQPVGVNDEMDFKCAAWRADDSMFTPPSDVTFSEFTIPAIPAVSGSADVNAEANPSVQNIQCGACDQLGDAESRSQCRAALGC